MALVKQGLYPYLEIPFACAYELGTSCAHAAPSTGSLTAFLLSLQAAAKTTPPFGLSSLGAELWRLNVLDSSPSNVFFSETRGFVSYSSLLHIFAVFKGNLVSFKSV